MTSSDLRSGPQQRTDTGLRFRRAISRPSYDAIKRLIDVTLCIASLPLTAPVMALCALLVYIDDPGPVLFRQRRTGRGGRRFAMYKLRTMVVRAEELKAEYSSQNELAWPDFKISNDPRITAIGRILRKTSLDEVPQILNVLKGDMSLVGPRPTSFEASTYALWHTERLEVLPGVTGLWQISGRSDIDFDGRVRLDVAYIERRDIWLDLRILAHTVGAVLHRRGAY
jgi:lipopolysaccharide/colanic/teichoic acid biosynthesis glycosyltransferase